MTLRLGLLLLLLYIVSMGAISFISYQYGQSDNAVSTAEDVADEKSRCLSQQARQLSTTLDQVTKLAKDAREASIAISKTIASQKLADQKTTQEIRHALSVTAPLRVDCLFDDGIMHQLASARDRANAATTAGFIDTVRSNTGTHQ